MTIEYQNPMLLFTNEFEEDSFLQELETTTPYSSGFQEQGGLLEFRADNTNIYSMFQDIFNDESEKQLLTKQSPLSLEPNGGRVVPSFIKAFPSQDQDEQTTTLPEIGGMQYNHSRRTKIPSSLDEATNFSSVQDDITMETKQQYHCLKPENAKSTQHANNSNENSNKSNDQPKKVEGSEPQNADESGLLPPDFKPLPYSVIVGKGKESRGHVIGNQRLRVLASNYLLKYAEASTKPAKSAIVSTLLAAVREACPVGAFIRLGKDGRWYSVSESSAREKVGYTFRDLLGERYRSSSKAKAAMRSKQRTMKFQKLQKQNGSGV